MTNRQPKFPRCQRHICWLSRSLEAWKSVQLSHKGPKPLTNCSAFFWRFAPSAEINRNAWAFTGFHFTDKRGCCVVLFSGTWLHSSSAFRSMLLLFRAFPCYVLQCVLHFCFQSSELICRACPTAQLLRSYATDLRKSHHAKIWSLQILAEENNMWRTLVSCKVTPFWELRVTCMLKILKAFLELAVGGNPFKIRFFMVFAERFPFFSAGFSVGTSLDSSNDQRPGGVFCHSAADCNLHPGCDWAILLGSDAHP